MQDLLDAYFEPEFLTRKVSLEVPHSAMHAGERHSESLFFTNEGVLFSHRYFCIGKVLEYKPATVVDLGCGHATLLQDMRHNRMLQPYIGVDVRQLMRVTRDSAFVLADLMEEEWCMKADVAPCIVLSEVIEHFERDFSQALLARAAWSLAPGGVMIITCPVNHPAESPEKDFKKYGHLHYWPVYELLDEITRLGLRTDEIWPARFPRDRLGLPQIKATLEANHGSGASALVDELVRCYGQRVCKSIFAYVQTLEKATAIRLVVSK